MLDHSQPPASKAIRHRRLRRNPQLRSIVRETFLQKEDLIMPLFIKPGAQLRHPIASMPGIFQFSIDEACREVEAYLHAGLKSIILFGIPETKDPTGSDALSHQGIIAQGIRALRKNFPHLVIITDCCFCEYTSHGHCGVLSQENPASSTAHHNTPPPHTVLNDPTLKLLAKQALIHAAAGSDIIAPSGMMDHMVAHIRSALDQNGFSHISIMSYAVKYASALYGPFREAAQSHMESGDRKSYQMDIANAREALREASLDATEGADILMVKPALPYLDILKSLRDNLNLPLAAYQVSGEYAMIKAAAQNKWLSEDDTVIETLTAIKRAGADLILSYFAYQAAKKYL